jgi:predicted CXXCH cytochrome family protein
MAADFVGSPACEPCHQTIYDRQRGTHHARALLPLSESPLAARLKPLRERGGASLRYETVDGNITAIAELAGVEERLPLEWAFGAGSKAMTPVGRLGDTYVEHRVSWYKERNGLGLTPGHDPTPSRDVQSALGIRQTAANSYRCFNCHAANVRPGPEISRMLPGVGCERCHGPGGAHIAAAKKGLPVRNTVLHPGRLPARAQVEVCAECHRSPDSRFKSAAPELESALSVRFAPVGLAAAKCFQKSGKLSCVTCHNPHGDPLPRGDEHYTQICLGCHAKTTAHKQMASAGSCLECHMKTASPALNLTFTDHRIRVYPD